jgi:hypothetical protein
VQRKKKGRKKQKEKREWTDKRKEKELRLYLLYTIIAML